MARSNVLWVIVTWEAPREQNDTWTLTENITCPQLRWRVGITLNAEGKVSPLSPHTVISKDTVN